MHNRTCLFYQCCESKVSGFDGVVRAGLGAGAYLGAPAGQPGSGGGGGSGLSATQKVLIGVLVPIGVLLLAAAAAVVALRARTVDHLPESDMSVGVSGGSGRVRQTWLLSPHQRCEPVSWSLSYTVIGCLHMGRAWKVGSFTCVATGCLLLSSVNSMCG